MARINNSVRANFLSSMKRKSGRQIRYTGDEPHIATQDKVIRCPVPGCGHTMEFWKEDRMGDLIYTCTNPYCYKSKDWSGSLTVELKKLTKQLQMNSRKFYRTYMGDYY
ncbi:MAG: hypothetical protein FK731_08885 [Asgard group archaeon]|nr:hypothetical protein [Asgard group archaeon]